MWVKAIYDFEATCIQELSFKKDDIIEVTRQNVGAGWWEGVKDQIVGLIPENYVEPCNENFEYSEDDDDDDDENEHDSEVSSPPTGGFLKTLQKKPSSLQENEEIIVGNNVWIPVRDAFTITITKEEKKKKYSGVQSYVSYSLKSDISTNIVSRRYKNFVWLYNRLCDKYPFIIIPTLPGKQLQGRFELEFLQQRKRRLEKFLNRVAQHPILRNSPVFHHFLTSSEMKEWKEGKRIAEVQLSDSFFDSVKLQGSPKDQTEIIDRFSKYIRTMDRHLQNIHQIGEHIKSRQEEIQIEISKLSIAWEHLVTNDDDKTLKVMNRISGQIGQISGQIGQISSKMKNEKPENQLPTNTGCWCWKDNCLECTSLTTALIRLSSTLSRISNAYKDNPGFGRLMEDFKDLDREIKRFPLIIKTYEQILNSYRASQTKEKEVENLQQLKYRADIATQVVIAEINHFHVERASDLKTILQDFINDQINLHDKVGESWKQLLPSVAEIQIPKF